MVKMDKNGRCRQVYFSNCIYFISRGSFSTKTAWAGFRVVFVDRWLLLTGGHYSEVVVSTCLTVLSFLKTEIKLKERVVFSLIKYTSKSKLILINIR